MDGKNIIMRRILKLLRHLILAMSMTLTDGLYASYAKLTTFLVLRENKHQFL